MTRSYPRHGFTPWKGTHLQPYSLKTAGGYTTNSWNNAGSLTSSTYSTTFGELLSFTCSSRAGNFRDPTPLSFRKVSSEYPYGYVYFRTSSGSRTEKDGRGCGAGATSLANVRASALDPYNKCLEKLYSSIRSDVDLSIDIYQGMQTVKMIKDIGSVILNPISTFAKQANRLVKRGGLSSSMKLTGSKWLEYQYGIRPTMNTIYSLTDELIGAVCSPGGFQLVDARATTRDRNIFTGITPFHSVVPGSTVSNDSRRCQIGLWYTVDDPTRNALSQFTSLNPVSFIYENIPFSFVLDWAIDVGGYLRMMETALMSGLKFHSGYRTDTRERKYTTTVSGSKRDKYSTTWTVSLKGSFFQRELSRVVLTSMPLPNLPQLNVQLGSERLLSAASLLTNLLSGKQTYSSWR